VSAATARPGGHGPRRLLTVMTQNMDEGTDFTPLFKSLLEGEIVADVSLCAVLAEQHDEWTEMRRYIGWTSSPGAGQPAPQPAQQRRSPSPPLPPKVPAENHAVPSSHTTPPDVTVAVLSCCTRQPEPVTISKQGVGQSWPPKTLPRRCSAH
jgi:hypothetical protein